MQKTLGTRKQYRISLKQFFNVVGVKPHAYFQQNREYEADLEKFAKSLVGHAPLSRRTKLSAVRGFVERNNVLLSKYFWKDLKKYGWGTGVQTLDYIPTTKDIKKILQRGDCRSRALFLVMASSGMRIDEVVGLTWNNIKLERNPVRLELPGKITKNGKPRITFISDEAKDVLIEWEKDRPKFLKRSINKTKKCLYKDKSENDERIFPIAEDTARNIWNSMLERSGPPYNERDQNTKNKIHKYHPHTLRKFFRTQLSIGCGNPDIPETLMGHEGYLTNSYRRFTTDELEEGYKKGVARLLVYTDIDLVSGITSKLEERQQSMNITIGTQATKIQNQETQHQVEMDKLYKIVNNLRKRIHETENHYEEELTRAYAQTDIILDEELKTPEQKAKEKKKKDKQWKKLKESMQ